MASDCRSELTLRAQVWREADAARPRIPPSWALTEVHPDHGLTGRRIDGLHESLLDVDPTGQEATGSGEPTVARPGTREQQPDQRGPLMTGPAIGIAVGGRVGAAGTRARTGAPMGLAGAHWEHMAAINAPKR